MEVRLSIPDDIAAQLRADGSDLGRRALEALALEGYRTEAFSLGQVAEMLGLSINEADGFLKARGVAVPSTFDDFTQDGDALEKLLSR